MGNAAVTFDTVESDLPMQPMATSGVASSRELSQKCRTVGGERTFRVLARAENVSYDEPGWFVKSPAGQNLLSVIDFSYLGSDPQVFVGDPGNDTARVALSITDFFWMMNEAPVLIRGTDVAAGATLNINDNLLTTSSRIRCYPTSTAGCVVDLPQAFVGGLSYEVGDWAGAASGGNITINAYSGDNIEGASSLTLSTNWAEVVLESDDHGRWKAVSKRV